jgi:hypothetical protein
MDNTAGKRVAIVKRDGKDTLVEAIPAKDHGQRIEMRGYDNPSSHMHGWPVQRRMDAWAYPLIEIFCKHGVGHPMPESVAWLEEHDKPGAWGVHGCDGCCYPPKKDYGDHFREGSNLGGA